MTTTMLRLQFRAYRRWRMKPSLLSTLAIALAATATSEIVVRNTTYGQVMGSSDGTISIFRSIPYAAPPVGDLRFRAPQPPTPWDTIKDVTAYPEPCPQLKVDGDIFLGNEDCLYLQVYVPDQAAEQGPLPVMLWIFGGGYILGDSDEFGWYDGTNLATKRGVIVVAMNYRLGPFGFMALDSLQSEDPNHSTGNAALQDQTFAMQWVHDNIANFGGDPKRVTIFGESAGGFSVCWHMVSEASAGLFASAIMESGSCDTPQFFQPVEFAVSWNTIYADAVGCNASYPAPAGQDPILSCLRTKSTNDLMKSVLDFFNPNWPFNTLAGDTVPVGEGTLNMTRYLAETVKMPKSMLPNGLPALAPFMPWGPAIDGSPAGLVDVPLRLIQEGKFNKVPLALGTNANEGSIFIPFFPVIVPGTSFPPADADIPKIIEHALDMYSPNLVSNLTTTIMASYPPYPDNNNWARASDLLTHMFFACSARRTARAMAAQSVPAYLYQFSHKLSFEAGLEYDLLGDYHTSELYFVWANEWPPVLHTFDENDWTISDAITGYWTNMAATGNPNKGPTAVPMSWPLYDPLSDMNLQLQVPVNVTRHLFQSVCNMWDGIANSL